MYRLYYLWFLSGCLNGREELKLLSAAIDSYCLVDGVYLKVQLTFWENIFRLVDNEQL